LKLLNGASIQYATHDLLDPLEIFTLTFSLNLLKSVASDLLASQNFTPVGTFILHKCSDVALQGYSCTDLLHNLLHLAIQLN